MSQHQMVAVDIVAALLGTVDRIDLVTVSLPLNQRFSTALGDLLERRALLVRVESEGAIGWGECAAFANPWYSAETVTTAVHVISDFLTPIVTTGDLSVADLLKSWRRVRGHAMAKAALENALLDLIARRLGVSLWQALGGMERRIPAGLALGLAASNEALLASVETAVHQGYQRVKLKIAPGRDLDPVQAVCAAFPGLALSVDANGSYSLADLATLRALDALGLQMIEQPLPAEDLAGHAVLVRELATPICLDESIASLADAERALGVGACSVICIKQGRVGGLLAARELAALCHREGIAAWCGGMLESGIGRTADLHLQTLPGFTLPGDTSATTHTFAADVIEPPIVVGEDGAIVLPSGCGVGVEVVEGQIDAVTIERTVAFPR